MIRAVPAGINSTAGYLAVANAHPSVLASGVAVTATNDDDGVALVLERLLAP